MKNSLPRYVLVSLLIIACAGAMILFRDATPKLDRKDFEAALSCWEKGRYPDYTLVLQKELDGQLPEVIKTVVENHAVTGFFINERPIEPVRDSYTIDGLFDMIDRELEMAEAPTKLSGQPQGTSLRARFDLQTGIPVVFSRLASQGKSAFLAIDEVVVPGRGVVLNGE